jgi:hypothetical protein
MKKKLKPSRTTTTKGSIGDSKASTKRRPTTRRVRAGAYLRRAIGGTLALRKETAPTASANLSPTSPSQPQIFACSDCPKIRKGHSKLSKEQRLQEEMSRTPPAAFYLSVHSKNPPPKSVLNKMHDAATRFIYSRCYFCGEPSRLTRGVVEVEGHSFTVYAHAMCFPLDAST